MLSTGGDNFVARPQAKTKEHQVYALGRVLLERYLSGVRADQTRQRLTAMTKLGEALFVGRRRGRAFRLLLKRALNGANNCQRRRPLPAGIEVYLLSGGRYLLADRLDV